MFFAHVNNRKPTRQKIGLLKDRDRVLGDSNDDIANLFNYYFSTVFTVERTEYQYPKRV